MEDAAERDERVLAWSRQGLALGERLLHVETPGSKEAFLRRLERAGEDWRGRVRTGQLVILEPGEAFAAADGFAPGPCLARCAAVVEQSLEDGYPAVRMSGDALAAMAVMPDFDSLMAFEAGLERLSETHPVSVLCLYDRAAFAVEVPAIASAHPRAVADAQVIVGAEPGLVHLAGEVDFSNANLVRGILSRASAEAGELTLDCRNLSFIDVRGASALADLTRRLSPEVQVRLRGPSQQLRTILSVSGWRDQFHVVDEPALS